MTLVESNGTDTPVPHVVVPSAATVPNCTKVPAVAGELSNKVAALGWIASPKYQDSDAPLWSAGRSPG